MKEAHRTERRPPVVVRIAAVLGAAVLIWLLIDRLGDTLFGPDYHRGRHVLSAVLATGLAVPMIVLAYRYLDRLPFSGLRRASPRTVGRLLAAGAVGYLIPAVLAVGGFLAAGAVRIEVNGSALGVVLSVLTLVVLVFLHEALPEELIFRGYLFRNLATVLPSWAVVVAQAVLFALFGVLVGAAPSGERVVTLLAFGLVQGCLRAITGTLWVPIGFHLAFQAAEQTVGPHGAGFLVDDLPLLQDIVLGLIPLALGVLAVRLLGNRTRRPPD